MCHFVRVMSLLKGTLGSPQFLQGAVSGASPLAETVCDRSSESYTPNPLVFPGIVEHAGLKSSVFRVKDAGVRARGLDIVSIRNLQGIDLYT